MQNCGVSGGMAGGQVGWCMRLSEHANSRYFTHKLDM